MRDSVVLSLLLIWCAAILVSGCSSPQQEVPVLELPGEISGSGPASYHFVSPGGSHTFYVKSVGDSAGLVVNVTGSMRTNNVSRVKTISVVHNVGTPKGVYALRTLEGFEPGTCTLDVIPVNGNASWIIRIQ